ncbi:hypothetical protein HOY80DRAFT_1001319 [Tuber brumale]|nr:hypothetical protein HOY80DRAFT_1001319 [Tuber brumale]
MIVRVTVEMVVKRFKHELKYSIVFDSLIGSRPIAALENIPPSVNMALTELLLTPPVSAHTRTFESIQGPADIHPSPNTPTVRSENTGKPEQPQHLHGLVDALEEARRELQAKTVPVKELEGT